MTYFKLFTNPRQAIYGDTAGGYLWPAGDWTRLVRFLLLGSETGTYSVGGAELTAAKSPAVINCLQEDGLRVVRILVDTSSSGRASANEPALFVLALAATPDFADAQTNASALAALSEVARTGADLCAFAKYINRLRGWGRGLRSAIAEWYLSKPVKELAYLLLREHEGDGWSHRDLLRMAHPKAGSPAHNALFQWVANGELGHLATADIRHGELRQVYACERMKAALSPSDAAQWVDEDRLTQDTVPAQWKTSARVWEALLPEMPYRELVRSLGNLTAVGLLAPQNPTTALVVARLIDRRRVSNSKMHPIEILEAWLAYQQEENPIPNVAAALEEAFYLAFEHIEPMGRRIYLGVDASDSMQRTACNGVPHLTAAMGSAALAMAVARRETGATIAAFHDRIWRVNLTRKDRLEDVSRAIVHEPRSTDGSLPMQDALRNNVAVDAFVLLTDNETWGGDCLPVQALDEYRRATGIPAKLVMVAMSASGGILTDPNDSLQMGVAGFDASVPEVVANFIR